MKENRTPGDIIIEGLIICAALFAVLMITLVAYEALK